MCDIFLSYSRKDYDIVRKIKQEIEHATNAKCWMDLDGISYESPDFTKIIAPAIEHASIFVFILTPNSQESRYARNELLLAKARNKHIFFLEPHKCEMTSEFILEHGHHNRNLYYVDYQRQKLYEEMFGLLNPNRIEANGERNEIEWEERKSFRPDQEWTEKMVVIDDAVSYDKEVDVATRQKENNLNLQCTPYGEYAKQVDVCPKCEKNPCECKKNSLLFAAVTYEINYRKEKENYKFQLVDINGHLVDNRHFLKVFEDDTFQKERSIHYDEYGTLIPEAEAYIDIKPIRHLLGCCLEDNHLYLITNEGTIKICDYTVGRCDGDGSLYYEHRKDLCKKEVDIKGDFIFLYEKKKKRNQWRTTIFEVKNGIVRQRLESDSKIDTSISWVVNQNKYNYIEENGSICPLKIETGEVVVFNGYTIAYYLGTTNDGNDLFVVQSNRTSKEWSVLSKSGTFVCKFEANEIMNVTNNRSAVILANKNNSEYGISSIDGKIIVGKQYRNIKEIRDGLFEMVNYENETEFYSLNDNSFYQGVFNGYIWNNNQLYNGQSKEIVFDDCIICHPLIKDLFRCCNSKNEWWIVDGKGHKFPSDGVLCDNYNSIFSQSSQSVINLIGNKPFIISNSGSKVPIENWPYKTFAYGIALIISDKNKIHYYDEKGTLHDIEWVCSKKIIDAKMFSKNLILVTLTNSNESINYEVLLTLDGKELLQQKHHGTYVNIVKLSEEYFTVYNTSSCGCCVMDMNGKIIIKPRYSRISLV